MPKAAKMEAERCPRGAKEEQRGCQGDHRIEPKTPKGLYPESGVARGVGWDLFLVPFWMHFRRKGCSGFGINNISKRHGK